MSFQAQTPVPEDGTVTATSSGARAVAELAKVCLSCRVAYHESVAAYRLTPWPGSAAHAVKLALPSPDPLMPDAVFGGGHMLIFDVVATYLTTAAGHLAALAALYATGEVMFAPGALIRASLEASARAMWVIGEGGDKPEDTLARACLEELLSAEEASKVAGRLAGKRSDIAKSRKSDFVALRTQVMSRFPGATVEQLGNGELAGHERAKLGQAVSWMFTVLRTHADSGVTETEALGIYDYLSNVTHLTLYPTRELRRWVPSATSPGQHDAVLSVEPDFLQRQTRVAVVGFYNALSYLTSYFSWPDEVHNRLSDDIDALLPGMLRSRS